MKNKLKLVSEKIHETLREIDCDWYDSNSEQLSQQLVIKWIRDVKKLFIKIDFYGGFKDEYFWEYGIDELCESEKKSLYKLPIMLERDGYLTYEDAEEGAIIHCIEIIKKYNDGTSSSK